MYKAKVMFTDLQDNSYIYHAGDIFPRDGLKVSKKRIAELLTDTNRRHKSVIEEIPEEVVPEEKPKKGGKKKNVK